MKYKDRYKIIKEFFPDDSRLAIMMTAWTMRNEVNWDNLNSILNKNII